MSRSVVIGGKSTVFMSHPPPRRGAQRLPHEAPATESAGLVNLCVRLRSLQLHPDSGPKLPASRWCHPDVYLETDPCLSK
jgi:hypothetical protein